MYEKISAIATKVEHVQILQLQQIKTSVGDLVICEDQGEFPFTPTRVFYLYDIPAGESRGAHAHKECHQFLVAIAGAFSVEFTDGVNSNKVLLNQPYYGLHIPPGIWASEVEFSGGSICLVLASSKYDENDYIRDFDDFLNWKLGPHEIQ